MHDLSSEVHFLMFSLAELAWGYEGVNVFERGLHQTEVPPPLRRSLVGQGAAKTLRFHTGITIKLKQDMSGAPQPVFVHGVELQPLPIFENSRPSNQRDIVIMDNIKAFLQNPMDTCPF